MRKNPLKKLGILAALLALAGCAAYPPHAERLLTGGDRKLLVEAAQQALEVNKTGEAARWENPKTKARGTVTPLRTYSPEAGPPCRDYEVAVVVEGRTHVARDTACRQPAGNWKSVNHPGLAGARAFEGMEYALEGGRYVYYPYRYGPYDYPYPYPHPYYGPRFRFGFGYTHSY